MIRSPDGQRSPVVALVDLAVAKHVGVLGVQQRGIGLALHQLAEAVEAVCDVLPGDGLLFGFFEVIEGGADDCLFFFLFF